jgi:hypothetical protein
MLLTTLSKWAGHFRKIKMAKKNDKTTTDDLPTITEFVASTSENITSIQEQLVYQIFKCEGTGSPAHTLLYSCSQSSIQTAMETLKDFVLDKDKVSEIYKSVSAALNLTGDQDITSLADEMIVDYFENKSKAITSAKEVKPEEIPGDLYIMSALEVSAFNRNALVSKVLEKVELGKILNEYGVGGDYRPSVEVLEIAVLSALISSALNSSGKGSLWTPGKPF